MLRDWIYLQYLRFDMWRGRRQSARWRRLRAVEMKFLADLEKSDRRKTHWNSLRVADEPDPNVQLGGD